MTVWMYKDISLYVSGYTPPMQYVIQLNNVLCTKAQIGVL